MSKNEEEKEEGIIGPLSAEELAWIQHLPAPTSCILLRKLCLEAQQLRSVEGTLGSLERKHALLCRRCGETTFLMLRARVLVHFMLKAGREE